MRVRERVVAHDEIVSALRIWVKHHPSPDKPVRVTFGGGALSPSGLLHEVEERTPVGHEFEVGMQMLARERPDMGIDGVLRLFYEPKHGRRHTEHPFRLNG